MPDATLPDASAPVPLKWIGPLTLCTETGTESLEIPLATYETPLWPSTRRGAQVSRQCGGIRCTLVDDRMTRSILLEAPHAAEALRVATYAREQKALLQSLTAETSRYARLLETHHQIVGNLLYLRFAFETGDASGHNMATQAADRILHALLEHFPTLKHVSVSGNYCTDKKVSAVNGILGRGKYVVTEALIPANVLRRHLKTTAGAIAELNVRKNLIGTLLAGGTRTANAHVANILLAFYLATGQDAANIIEGSQAITHAEARGDDLYFSVTFPNLILGTVGNGKDLPFVGEILQRLGCRENRPPAENARRLAKLCAAAAWCGELSLMAALTHPGELIQAHLRLERP